MTGRPLALTASVVLALGVALSGCAADSSAGADRKPGKNGGKARWTCTWSPTMDDDWHNDALCTNGTRTERPYLRPQDDVIGQAELMESARTWARRRNGG
ncbi:hypothetical protein J2X46_004511 [Nocardioides sp. BE266]|uniref:hypothetical protein n=1 Tax=Nocardioides sp. BE266 TaxID=2817725 RepID=UPI0028630385|nr:hypothetical protein [Nocardioides sp. BE266]MDR7255504.1 hypothetical protein [Nocardioides sp. BE266]